MNSSAFYPIENHEIISQNESAIAFLDRFPISPGHTLVVPRRTVPSFFDLSDAEQVAVWEFVAEVRTAISLRFHPAGFNIGLNDGEAAGQTVLHAHIHIIPRYLGDVPDPRGGIRWIIPSKAKYW